MELIQEKQLRFVNGVMEGRIMKQCVSECDHFLAGYVEEISYWDMEELNEILWESDKAISGQFHEIDDPYTGMDFWNVDIKTTGVDATVKRHLTHW